MQISSPHPIPDRHGANLFSTDPQLRALLALYLPRDVVSLSAHSQASSWDLSGQCLPPSQVGCSARTTALSGTRCLP